MARSPTRIRVSTAGPTLDLSRPANHCRANLTPASPSDDGYADWVWLGRGRHSHPRQGFGYRSTATRPWASPWWARPRTRDRHRSELADSLRRTEVNLQVLSSSAVPVSRETSPGPSRRSRVTAVWPRRRLPLASWSMPRDDDAGGCRHASSARAALESVAWRLGLTLAIREIKGCRRSLKARPLWVPANPKGSVFTNR
jgi:hypothetical protein